MVTQADTVTLVANVRSANVMADRMYRLLPRGARLRLLAVGNTATVRCQLRVGGVTIVDEALVNLRATAPIIPDDLVLDWTAVVGGEVLLTFISTAADAARWKLDIA